MENPVSEDAVFRLICDGRERFEAYGPAKSLDELWQRQAARRIMALIESDPRWADSAARATRSLQKLTQRTND